MKATIYHNPRCSKSRQTLQLLESKGIELEVIDYTKRPLSKNELKKLAALLDVGPCALLRTNEGIYKEKYKNKELSFEACIEAMVAYPVLMQRPVVVVGTKAVLGRPPENVLRII